MPLDSTDEKAPPSKSKSTMAQNGLKPVDNIPSRRIPVQLAHMGCIAFQYDMEGYADSVQIPFEVAHSNKNPRPEMNSPHDWGFFSPQADLRLQSILGLQTYNSIPRIDFLCQLPDVDPDRLAVTGASSGGTQTLLVCAIDPRPAVAVPAVMVSTAMQGGCTCENAELLHWHRQR